MKINQVTIQTPSKSTPPSFGMALILKSRAINNTSVFPNANADFISDAVHKGIDRLRQIAKNVDITVDVEPPERGLDFKGEKGILVVSAKKLDPARNKDQISRLVSGFLRAFTEPISFVKLDIADLKKSKTPEDVIVEMATEAKKRL